MRWAGSKLAPRDDGSSSCMREEVPVALQFERCAIGVFGEDIKALFVRNDAPEFPAFFQRAYSQSASAGGISWIARDGQGKLVGHYAALPRVFRSEGRQARAALLVDLSLDRVHRNFWSAAELCRRAAADLRKAGDFDFAYSDPSPVARGIMRAAGFTERGTLERFAAPLNLLYNGFFHVKSRAVSLTVERIGGLDDPRVAQALSALRPGAYFQGQRSVDLYATRLGLGAIPTWEWLLLRDPHGGATPCALARTGVTVENVRQLPRLDRLFERLAVRPTYFTTYQVAIQPWAVRILQETQARGTAEIGAHLHPWNTPPFEEAFVPRNTMLVNLPARLQAAKLDTLTDTLCAGMGRRPLAFRAGRWAFGPSTAAALLTRGYRVDSSVTPV